MLMPYTNNNSSSSLARMVEKNFMHGKIMKFGNYGKIMEFWHEIAFLMSISLKFFLLASLAHEFFVFEQSNPKSFFLHNKMGFLMLIQLFMQGIYFCLLNGNI